MSFEVVFTDVRCARSNDLHCERTWLRRGFGFAFGRGIARLKLKWKSTECLEIITHIVNAFVNHV